MATAAAPPTNPERRRGLALAEGLTAASAMAGAVGLANGSIDLGATINGRLPFESPAFGVSPWPWWSRCRWRPERCAAGAAGGEPT